MDHSQDHASVDGPWAGGWGVALVAGAISIGLARWMGDVSLLPALAVGVLSFGVFGVLLGAGGVELSPIPDDQGHDDHGHH